MNMEDDNKHFHSLKLRENILIIFYLYLAIRLSSHVILWVHKHIYFKLHQMQFSLPFYFSSYICSEL